LTAYTAYKFDVVARYVNLLYPHELVGIPSDVVTVVEWTSNSNIKCTKREEQLVAPGLCYPR
jgi:hypothetical protein